MNSSFKILALIMFTGFFNVLTHELPWAILFFIICITTVYGIVLWKYLPKLSKKEEILLLFIFYFVTISGFFVVGITLNNILITFILVILETIYFAYIIKDINFSSGNDYERLSELIKKGNNKRLIKEVKKIFLENGIGILAYDAYSYGKDDDGSLIFNIMSHGWRFTLIVRKDGSVKIEEAYERSYD